MSFIIRILLVLALLVPSQFASAQFTDQRTWTPTSGGSANAQTLAIPNVSGPPLGVVFRFIPQFTNSGAATLNINGTGAKPVRKPSPAGPVALIGGELVAGQIAEVMYDGTNIQIVSNINATAAQVVPNPGGYLTPCTQVGTPTTGCSSGTLLPTGDVSGATTLFYTPVASGAQVPIWNGTQYVPFTFTELTLTLGSSNLANTAYDVCVFNNGGAPTIGTSVAWSSSAAGSSSRGTGAGTAQITRTNGFWTNAVSVTVRNGGSTYNVPANQCTIVASVLIDSSNGQVSLTSNYGQSRKWLVWNFYNRLPLFLQGGDPTSTWNYNSNTIRPSQGNANNYLRTFTGLPEEKISVKLSQTATVNQLLNSRFVNLGIGVNSTTTFSQFMSVIYVLGDPNQGTVGAGKYTLGSQVNLTPLGGMTFTSLEQTGTSTMTLYGGIDNMLLTADWRG